MSAPPSWLSRIAPCGRSRVAMYALSAGAASFVTSSSRNQAGSGMAAGRAATCSYSSLRVLPGLAMVSQLRGVLKGRGAR
eukprot:scaffold153469_cov32-Tisochrysis_lutea.AAC.2